MTGNGPRAVELAREILPLPLAVFGRRVVQALGRLIAIDREATGADAEQHLVQIGAE